jgi:hypothetical protein
LEEELLWLPLLLGMWLPEVVNGVGSYCFCIWLWIKEGPLF